MTGDAFDAYEHSILDVCQTLHGHTCGSGDGLPRESLEALQRWLETRITERWHPRLGQWSKYDELVRQLAWTALRDSRGEI